MRQDFLDMRRGGESKSDQLEEDVHFSEEVLSAAIEFCASPDFEDAIADFKLSYLHVFEEYSYCKSEDAEDVEQSLECTEVFEAYQELVERLLENFTKRHHSTVQEFFRECSDAIEGKFVPLFEEHENKWYYIYMYIYNILGNAIVYFLMWHVSGLWK